MKKAHCAGPVPRPSNLAGMAGSHGNHFGHFMQSGRINQPG